VDVRKIGIWMVAVGALALGTGIVIDAVQQADDPTLAQREGIFDLSRFAHALFFGGLCVAIVGTLALLVGAHLYNTNGRVTVGRRIAQVGAPIAAIVLMGATAAYASNSALGEPSDDGTAAEADAASTGEATDHEHADGADEHAHEDTAAAPEGEAAADGEAAAGHDHGPVIEGTATGDSPCEIASPTPASPGQVGTGEGGSQEEVGEHGSRGMVAQSPLTPDEHRQLQEQMRLARTVVDQFPTVADAEAAGYKMSTVYVPCIGAHYTNTTLVFGFDPAKPSELLYDGSSPDSKIVGLSYLVFNPGGAPEGFAGKNDHWHQHNANGGLCFGAGGVVIGGEEVTEEECAERGGEKRELTDIWMMHAWVVPGFECSWGVFAGECPELGGRTGGTAWDDPAPS
jgi:hypothetical protein